jgi:hypothetical protein
MIKCYEIVPMDDGYTRLCESKETGLQYLEPKGSLNFKETILFLNKNNAEAWLQLWGMEHQYLVEECWLSPNIVAECSWRD